MGNNKAEGQEEPHSSSRILVKNRKGVGNYWGAKELANRKKRREQNTRYGEISKSRLCAPILGLILTLVNQALGFP